MRKTRMLSICLGLILWCPVQCFGQGPAMGTYQVPKADTLGVPLRAARMAAAPMLASGGLPSSIRGDWKTDAFWQAPSADSSSVKLDPLPGWVFEDRLGDARRKLDHWLITWGYGGDTYIFIRFDMGRVVTRQALEAASDGYLPSDLYNKMCSTGGGPILSAKAMLEMFFTFSLGKGGNYGRGRAYNWSVVQFNDFPVSGYEQNTAFLGTYKPIKLTVPTNQLRYPTMPPTGTPTPAWNMIVLKTNLTSLQDPDTKRPMVDNKTIHYLFDSELRFKAMAPIFLVHGTNAAPDTWDVPKDNSFNDYFKTFPGICFNDIALEQNGPVDGNGQMLEGQIADRLDRVGAKQCHIVAHSKGGNDSRSMIFRHYTGQHLNEHLEQPRHFEVLSLYTLETPHRGTVIADISWAVLHAGNPHVVADPSWPGLQDIIDMDFHRLHDPPDGDPNGHAIAPTGEALAANRTGAMDNWNRKKPFDYSHANTDGRPIKFYNTAADADYHIRNRKIDDQENAAYSGSLKPWENAQYPLNSVATSAYQMLYWARKVESRTSTRPGGYGVQFAVTELYVPAVNPHDNGTWNDLVVAIDSAIFEGGIQFCPAGYNNDNNILYGNHSGIKTHSMAAAIIGQISTDWIIQ